MSKRTHPTIGSLKQGQTIYSVSLDSNSLTMRYKVFKIFMYSHKVKLPPHGYYIRFMPVSFIRNYIKEFGNKHLFYSYSKAARFANV